MPIYEFECNKCNNVFEKILPYKKRNKKQKCDCGNMAQKRDISLTNFQLKGNWFKTKGEY